MANNQSGTRKQHYVPQVYLKNFSDDGKTLFYYDVLKKEPSNISVPIKSICYEMYIYEYYDENGEIDSFNFNEKMLQCLEIDFSKQLDKLVRIARCKENIELHHIFTKEEYTFWIFYVYIQMFRTPRTIKRMSEHYSKIYPDFGQKHIKNICLTNCLPFYQLINSLEMNDIIMESVETLLSMDMFICVNEHGDYFTSDCPVVSYSSTDSFQDTEWIVLPLTKRLAFLFLPCIDIKKPVRGKIRCISEDEYQQQMDIIALGAYQKIYSNSFFTPKLMRNIDKLREDLETE